MNFLELTEKVLSAGGLMPKTNWPAEISVPSDSNPGLFGSSNKFWDNLKKLREYTDVSVKNFSKEHQGSTGWEYSITMALANDKFFYTSPFTSGDYTQVTSKHSLKIETDFDHKSQTITDKVILDGKEVGKINFKGENEIKLRAERIQKQEYKLRFVCNFHSHPVIKIQNINREIYSFFSTQDLNSFLGNSLPFMGLVTDRLWFVGKTPESRMPDFNQLKEVTHAEVLEPERFELLAADTMHASGIVLYKANMGGKLTRV